MADNEKTSIENLGEDIKRQFTITSNDILQASDRLSKFALDINNAFGQGRQRIIELQTTLADTTPLIARLGGDIGDVSKTISDVAIASRRNVVATSEEVEKLFAASKVLDLSASDLTNSFLNVGIGLENIGKNLEDSVNYVQSIGGNVTTVMKDVNNNMDQMNRFQFENGVQGLTKMAAQASMLRFNMGETFRLAERVLTPEGAIETAAAFQRLGVSAGNLVDPFQLMNLSINDPSGLQNSLANVAKQFTEFDEKTKTFKINPQGVLTLKQIEAQTGVSAAELSKMGLAAAELDQRLSAINTAGLTIVNEEDKQYLANIAKMEGGTYKVTLEDGTKKELSELSQPEFDKLIQQQKDGPKTLEDIARAQTLTTDVIKNDVAAIRAKVVGGAVSAAPVLQGKEGLRRGLTNISGEFSQMGGTKDVREFVEGGIGSIKELFNDFQRKDVNFTTAISNFLEKLDVQGKDAQVKLKAALLETGKRISEHATDKTYIERELKKVEGYIMDKASGVKKQPQNVKQTISSLVEGRHSQIKEVATASSAYQKQTNDTKSQVELVGSIKIDVSAPPGFSDEKITRAIYDKLNEQSFKDFVVNIATPKNPTKSPVSTNYV